MNRAIPWLCLGLLLDWPAIGQAPIGPELRPSDVVNAADYSGGGVAPGEVVVIHPSNAGPPQLTPWGLSGDSKTTTTISETRVLFDGEPATLVYAVRGQIGAIVPRRIAGKKTTNVVVEYRGQPSPAATLAVVDSAPALFTLDATGKGQAAMLNDTGCCNSVRNPAMQGKPASLYATGEGRIPSVGIAGNISVTVGGISAPILYTGNFGALQVNFRVPANAPVGDAVPLVLRVGGRQSSPDVTMAVRSARRSVLVLHHDAAIRRRAATILRNAGYRVLTAGNVEEARAQAGEQPDLVILDLASPEQETLEMIGALRKTRPQLRVLALSRALDPGALRAADVLGAQAVLTQPLNALQVRSRVRSLLEIRPAVY